MITDVFTLDTTYRLQIKTDGDWHEYSQVEYSSAADIHKLASEMYGGLKPDEYRLVEITRTVIEN